MGLEWCRLSLFACTGYYPGLSQRSKTRRSICYSPPNRSAGLRTSDFGLLTLHLEFLRSTDC